MTDAFDDLVDQLDFDALPPIPQRVRVYDAPDPLRPVRMRRQRDGQFAAAVLMLSLAAGMLIGRVLR